MDNNEDNYDVEEIKEQDRYLPIANVSRIMKRALPENAKIAKDAKETIQECVSEFICFITSEASDRCQQEKRKTINGEDILWAMSTLGFEHYAEAMKIYLAKYRETTKIERAGIKDGSDDPSVNLMNAAAGGSNGPTQGLDGVLYAGGGGRHHHLPHAYLGQGGGGSGGGGGVGGGGGHHIYYGGV